eukprot:TRINITY_DN9227_c0_g1_i1.p1 TRINITY_DN9227_c0_g1~~TRINITY_DN9227_c0_g1_i1.p1  ORF type:complete len:170 (+),score=35.22 TRINITY_DN9227_c0_g1_i1:75-512(+)
MAAAGDRPPSTTQTPLDGATSDVQGGAPAAAPIDIASLFDDPVLGAAAVNAAQEPPASASVHALPLRAYMEQTVVPILLQGLDALARARMSPATAPEDPQEWLAAYLFKNNPQKSSDKLQAARNARTGAPGAASPGGPMSPMQSP